MRKIKTAKIMCKDSLSISPSALCGALNDIIEELNIIIAGYANDSSVRWNRLDKSLQHVKDRLHRVETSNQSE